jgi:hypothetical protein
MARDVASKSDSDEAFARVEEWITGCTNHHDSCESGPTSSSGAITSGRPKRLIDLSSGAAPNRLCLVETVAGDEAPYIALSYCWGGIEQFATIRETLDQRLEGFELDDLAQTHRDAVAICRRLVVRFLWIDACCIIQGDHDDWVNEVPRMGTIYGNVYLVIADTLASNPSKGIFSPSLPSYTFNFTLAGKQYRMCIKEQTEHDFWINRHSTFDCFWGRIGGMKADASMPLLGRGWTFQERLLAKRVLHYTPRELIWECRTRSDCECAGMHWQERHPVEFDRTAPPIKMPTLETLRSMDVRDQDLEWRRLIMEYSQRESTHRTDRLPALSSLTQQFQTSAPGLGTHLAGMWSETLSDSLMWRPRSLYRRWSCSAHTDLQTAPSWSWASCEGGVPFYDDRAQESRIIEAVCQPASMVPCGAVRAGYVLVQGQVGVIDEEDATQMREANGVAIGEALFALKMSFTDWNIWWAVILRKSIHVAGTDERVCIDTAGGEVFEGVARSIIRIV